MNNLWVICGSNLEVLDSDRISDQAGSFKLKSGQLAVAILANTAVALIFCLRSLTFNWQHHGSKIYFFTQLAHEKG